MQVERHRSKEPQSPVNEMEKQCLRQLWGSLQHAAVQNQPDISATVGILQPQFQKHV